MIVITNYIVIFKQVGVKGPLISCFDLLLKYIDILLRYFDIFLIFNILILNIIFNIIIFILTIPKKLKLWKTYTIKYITQYYVLVRKYFLSILFFKNRLGVHKQWTADQMRPICYLLWTNRLQNNFYIIENNQKKKL